MQISNKGKIDLIGLEGICQSKYKDSVGVWTVGIGATQSEYPDIAKWPADKKLSVIECIQAFNVHIQKYERAVSAALTKPVEQHIFDALVSWCYNVGTGWLRTATVIKLVNNGIRGKPLYDALMMFRKPPEIIERRRKEANLLAFGRYSNPNGVALLFPVSPKGHPIYSAGKQVSIWEYFSPEIVPTPAQIKSDTPQILYPIVQKLYKWWENYANKKEN